jgi:hypothetical protein
MGVSIFLLWMEVTYDIPWTIGVSSKTKTNARVWVQLPVSSFLWSGLRSVYSMANPSFKEDTC